MRIDRINKLMAKNHLSQGNLAKRLNIGRTTLNHYFTNRRTPKIDLLINLSNIFNCPVDYLLGTKDNITYEQLEFKEVKTIVENTIQTLTLQQKLSLMKIIVGE